MTSFRGRDGRVAWLAVVLTVAASLWVLAIAAAPTLLAQHASAAAVFIFEIGARICHQRPERSFHIAGAQMPVCARCFGLYVSGALGAATAWLGRAPTTPALLDNRIRVILALATLPTALSVAVEWLGFAHPPNVLRALLALSLGASVGWAFVRSFRVSRGR